MSGESTSILDLPIDPVGGGGISNNVSLNANEKVAIQTQQSNQQNNLGVSLDQTTINQIVSGLQQASINVVAPNYRLEIYQ